MNRRAARTLVGATAIAFTAAACSGSDPGSSSDVDSATQFFVDFADVVGVELDRSCVEAAVQTLSPEDAKTLADAPTASMELISSAPFNDTIDAVGERIFDDCVTRELGE